MTKFPHTERWQCVDSRIMQGAIQEQQGRCPTGLWEPEALHLDRFLSSERIQTCELLIKLHMCKRGREPIEFFVFVSLYVAAVVIAGNKLWRTQNIRERETAAEMTHALSLTLSNTFTLMAKQPENVFLHERENGFRARWDWRLEDYWRWGQDKMELWTVWGKGSALCKKLRLRSFPHWFTLSSVLPGRGVERYSVRRYPAYKWIPRGQEELKKWKKGLDIFHGADSWKCKSAFRSIRRADERGDFRRNHAWFNTKSTHGIEI